MSHVIRPVGPEDPSVYWRRRLAVLVAVLAVLLVAYLVFRLVSGGGDDDTATGATGSAATEGATEQAPGETASATATEPAPAETSGGVAACEPASLQVTATADATTYAAGAQPKVGMLIKNIGTAPCTLDAGSAALELVIVSGEDRVWSSDDCQQDASSSMQTVQPGAELASSVVWPMQRSAESCPADLPAPKPGTYQLTGRVGEITSGAVAFTIT